MLRIALGIALVAGFGQAASATTWKMIEPEDYAERCPVIVRGTIVSVEKRQPGRDRVDVVIRIEQIFKNALSDSPLKVGGDLTTRRNVGNRLSGSEDMDYPEKTRALWLVEMDEKGEFRIDRHPSQKQSAKLVLDLGATAFQRAPDADFARGPIARKEWIEERRIADTWQSEEQRKAKTLELFALAGELAEASTVDEKSMRRISALPKDRRRDFLRYSTYEQPLKGERLGAVLAHMLARDTDDEIRAFAAIYLAGRGSSPRRLREGRSPRSAGRPLAPRPLFGLRRAVHPQREGLHGGDRRTAQGCGSGREIGRRPRPRPVPRSAGAAGDPRAVRPREGRRPARVRIRGEPGQPR